MYYPSTATSTSADFLTFVVTILKRLSRPHGINHTSFIVYLPNLRIKVTVAFGNFTVVCQLVRLIRLHIRFLFVRPRVRYCFFSPKRHRLKLASRYRVRRQLRPEWTFTTDVWHARHTQQKGLHNVEPLCLKYVCWNYLAAITRAISQTLFE